MDIMHDTFSVYARIRTPEFSRGPVTERESLLRDRNRRELAAVPERQGRNWLRQVDLRSTLSLSKEERINERLRRASLALRQCVEVNTKKLGGIPVVKGTRFPIAQILSQVADGDSADDLAENFDLDRECLRTLLHALAACLDRPFYK